MITKLLVGIILVASFMYIGTHETTVKSTQNLRVPLVSVEKTTIHPSLKLEAVTEPLNAPVDKGIDVTIKPEAVPTPVVVAAPLDNETIIWNRLIAEGYTREQTAGIMGNLQQEHNFNTSDAAGGLGIAQWIGNRKTNLMARENYLDINVQLDYLMYELRGSESNAHAAIISDGSIENSVIAFQDKFERCGDCRQETRMGYAYNILGRH